MLYDQSLCVSLPLCILMHSKTVMVVSTLYLKECAQIKVDLKKDLDRTVSKQILIVQDTVILQQTYKRGLD